MDLENFLFLFKAIMKPQLEYINTVWSLKALKDKDINHDRECSMKSY